MKVRGVKKFDSVTTMDLRIIRQYIYDIGGEDFEGLFGIFGFVIIIVAIIWMVIQRKKIRWWK